jgi:hypothetical protein
MCPTDIVRLFCRYSYACLPGQSLEMNPTDPEAAVLLGSIYTLAMQYDHARPILERAVKMSKGVKEHRAMYQQALTNLALSNLRGGRPKDALKFSRRLYKTFGGAATETYAHTRTVALPYDVESILLSIKARNTFVKALRHTGVNCPSGEWHMAWNITKVPDSVPGTTITLLNPTEAYLSFGEDYAVQFAGELLLPYLNEYHEHFVYRLDFEGGGNDAFVWGQAGLVHGKCTLIGGAYWVMYPTQEIAAIPEGVYVKAVTINDPVISLLPMYNAANFYHFVCEGLLRLLYVWDDFIADPTMKLLVPGVMPGATSLPRHIEQSLPLLNISRDRLILFNSEPNRVYHFTNKFTVVDWMAPAVDEHGSLGEDPWSPVYQPRGGLHMLRDRFHQVLREHGKYTTAKPWHIVYVSRRRGVRMIANEGTVISQIRASFGYKRVLIHTGDESFIDQVAMFQKAALVIGAHGAGLSNLVFCSPGASVMIFPMRPHVDHTYGHMASALGLHHWVVTEVSSYYYGNYGEINDKNIELIIETATTILESGPSSRADL